MRKIGISIGAGIGLWLALAVGSAPPAEAVPRPTWKRVRLMLKHVYWRVKWGGLCWLQQYFPQQKEALPLVRQIVLPPDSKDAYATRWSLRAKAARWLALQSRVEAWKVLLKAAHREPHWRVRVLLARLMHKAPASAQVQAQKALEHLRHDRHPKVRKAAHTKTAHFTRTHRTHKG